MQRHNISLIGPPGVGKSSAGQHIAQQLNWRFIDTDAVIVQQQGMPVHHIIDTRGRSYFRQCEQQVCRDLAQVKQCVIATGGGFALCADNRHLLHTISHVYSLHANATTLTQRLSGSTQIRPGLQQHPPQPCLQQRMQQLLLQRHSTYSNSSFLHINTLHKSALQVAKEIVQRHQAAIACATTANHASDLLVASAGCPPYPLHIQTGGLKHVGHWLRFVLGHTWRVAIVADKTVWQHHGSSIAHSLQQINQPFDVWLVPGGERSKTMRTATRMLHNLLANGFTRDSCILALGGGCVSDLAGFVAATFARGIAWLSLPSSLLAMVDACIGGKTAVNLPQAKNMVGAFYPPKAILLDPQLLQTLPPAHLKCGVAEIIKHALLADTTLLHMLQQPNCCLHNEQLLQRAIAVKVALVQQDPFEQAERMLLNLGHTFGHALESATNYKLLHGNAVALGLLAAAHLSHNVGLCSSSLPTTIKQLLTKWQLPTQLPPQCSPQTIWQIMQTDKKRHNGQLRFILLKQPGSPCIYTQVPPHKVLHALNQLAPASHKPTPQTQAHNKPT
ncbi:MAG: 3-dehydroquinate synthase [Myxococcota bacterium]